MAVGLATAMTVLAPFMVASDGFTIVPTEEDFRTQVVQRNNHEVDWPFTIDEGLLLCARIMGKHTVYFAESGEMDDDSKRRVAVVSTDIFQLMVNGRNDLLRPYDDLAQLILRMGPYELQGRRLCDQPRGTHVGPGEL